MPEIKTRIKCASKIKKLNSSEIAKEHGRHTVVRTKQSVHKNNQDADKEGNVSAENYAISSVISRNKGALEKTLKIANEQGKRATIRTKNNVKNMYSKIKERNIETSGARFDAGKRNVIRTTRNAGRATDLKGKRGPSSQTRNVRNYKQSRTANLSKEHGLKYARKQIRNSEKQKTTIKKSAAIVNKAAMKTVRTARRAVAVVKALISAIISAGWISIIVIIICCLFGAAFYFFGDESSKSYEPVSPQVEAYTTVIEKYAAEEGIGEYVELIKAIMMQESAGKGKDPMQSSESPYNTKYPQKPGGITNSNYSIKVGVKSVKDVLVKAKVESPIEMEHIRLALQGYNYGSGYIDWATKKDGGYNVQNTNDYSDMMAKEKGWSSYGDKQYVSHVLRYYPYGNYNYGVGNTVIVNIAKNQIGNKGGRKFWRWYGFRNHVDWCGCFVSWCADQCGYIKGNTLPKFAYVPDAVKWFKSKGQWQNKNYLPVAGDVVFFDWEGDGSVDHVGIVEKYEGNNVYTIEGNSGDKCKSSVYVVGNNAIFGYGVPKY